MVRLSAGTQGGGCGGCVGCGGCGGGVGGWHACGKERQSKKRNTVPIGTGHPARPDLAALVPPFHP